jgi:hypothetical protein
LQDLVKKAAKTELAPTTLGASMKNAAAEAQGANAVTPKQQELSYLATKIISPDLQDGLRKCEKLKLACKKLDAAFEESLTGMQGSKILSPKQEELYTSLENMREVCKACETFCLVK